MARLNFARGVLSRPRVKVAPSILILIAVATLSCFISFAKFDHCRNTNWKSPGSYVHACYSDIPVLLLDRDLDNHQWSYSAGEEAVEYPVVTGAIMWATTWIADLDKNLLRNYFDVNVFFISLLFIASVILVWRMRPQFAYLLALSPAVVASLFINWDLWGIVTMLAAILLFDKQRHGRSAVLLGISIATKFFPVLLLLPIALIFWRNSAVKAFLIYVARVSVVWLAINLPVLLTTPTGWWRFYSLNLARNSDWGSIWYALSVLGINIQHLNNLTLIALLLLLSALVLLVLEMAYTPTLAEISFIFLAATLCIGKVYSPQYVLWLAPLAVIAMRKPNQRAGFWVWQTGEAIYHVAIWQHLASVQGAAFGLPVTGYALATLFRILTTGFFIFILLRDALMRSPGERESQARSRSRLADFLFGTASSYP